jgi:uncharacterized protein (TIGR00730 family)
MHERKAMMADLSDAFIALPGGLGTAEELFEAATWNQLGIQDKPLGVLDIQGYFSWLATFLDKATETGFVPSSHRALFTFADDPAALIAALRNAPRVAVERWLDRSQR